MPELANTPTHGVTFTDIRKDLASFDHRFGLPTARLWVINSIAHSKTPYLAGTEEVEDTEIVHAIARRHTGRTSADVPTPEDRYARNPGTRILGTGAPAARVIGRRPGASGDDWRRFGG